MVCLLLLPTPQACYARTSACFLVIPLLFSGHVELNLGPPNQEMLPQVLACNQKVSRDIKDIKFSQLSFDLAITYINDIFSSIEETIGQLLSVAIQFEECQAELVRVKGNLSILKANIDVPVNRSRRNNSIVNNLSQVANESFEYLKSLVCDGVFHSLLNITTTSLEHIHRFENRIRTRPVQ